MNDLLKAIQARFNNLREEFGMKSINKFISLILRHKLEVIGVTLDEHGWANVDELIKYQGKSRTLNFELPEVLPPEILYHGTREKFVKLSERLFYFLSFSEWSMANKISIVEIFNKRIDGNK